MPVPGPCGAGKGFSVDIDRIVIMVCLFLASWAGVATRRRQKGQPIWDPVTILYALLAASLTMFILRRLGIAP